MSQQNTAFTSLPAEQINKLRDTFQLIDEDNDGEITTKDLKQVYQSIGHTVSDQQVEKMLSTKMTFTAFLALMSNGFGQLPNKNEILRALKVFSQDLEIDSKELSQNLVNAGMSQSEVDAVLNNFKSVKMNGDQLFMGNEFLNFVSS